MADTIQGVDSTDTNPSSEQMDIQEAAPPSGDEGDGVALTAPQEGSPEPVAMDMNNTADEDACRAEAEFSFKLTNLCKFKDQQLSPSCIVRNLPWKMLLMNRTSPTSERGTIIKTLGFFLQCNGESESTSWSCNASAELRLKRQTGEGKDFIRKIQHLFFSKENDWGFSNFMSLSDLLEPSNGWVKNDTIILEVYVTADAPHGVSWDSKKHTGYVGLKNQGATCYMNSLLQTLYFTNKLRRAVYQMPIEAPDTVDSVALALQRVFYDLQTSDKAVATKKLTKSFGWETLDSFMQHDVQELCRVLLDNMESKMKKTVVDGTIPELFKGTMLSYVKCKNVDYGSEREEPFYDIQLRVQNKSTIYESFDDYVEVETLDGDNKYDAGDHGLQDAEKGVLFLKLPPVLHLQLMRFQYDPMADANIKVNDRFEFQEEIDLTKYLQQPEETPSIYRLHAVLVHSGDNHGGHYVGYIDPIGDGKWCKFDDDVVSRCTPKEALDRNFGGHDDDISAKHSTNAYMLVYIRQSELKNVLCPIDREEIPPSLVKRLEDERLFDAQKRKEKNEAHLYITVNVFTEDVFYSHHGHDLFDGDKRPEAIRPFKVKRAETVNYFIHMVADALKVDASNLRLWPFQARQNETVRPSLLETPYTEHTKIIEVADGSPGTSWDVYIETLPADSPRDAVLPSFNKSHDVCLFIKQYDPKTERLSYCGHYIFPINCPLKKMMKVLAKLAGYPESTRLVMFEEVKPNQIERIHCDDGDQLLERAFDELMDGDIIIVQKDENVTQLRLPTAKDYSRELYYQVEVSFFEKNSPDDQGFTLELSLRDSYTNIVARLGEHLNIDPNMIQIFRNLGYKDTPGNAIKCTFDGYLKDLVSRASKTPRKLYYQKLSIPISELENKKQMKVLYVTSKLKEDRELTLHPSKTGFVLDLLEEAKKQVELSPAGSGKFRLLEVSGFKISSVLSLTTPLDNIITTTGKTLRLEEVPSNEVDIPDHDLLVPVAHFNQDTFSAFGTPFLFQVKNKEKVGNMKERIRKRIEVSEKEFEKYRICGVDAGKKTYLEDDEQIMLADDFRHSSGSFTSTKPWIGLDHQSKAPKRGRPNYLEKAIKIHN